MLHLPDIFHLQWAKATEEWLFLKELFAVKLILSLRGTHINYSPIADEALAISYRDTFPKLDGFHAVSQAIAQEAVRYCAAIEKTSVIYSGLPLDHIKTFEKKDYGLHKPIRLLSVGRFHWVKGYHYALDAIKRLIDQGDAVQYTLIAGNITEEILYQIHDLGLQSYIQIIDQLPQTEVFRHMQEADLLLLPSVEEGIANVVLEAMAIGLPVLSSDCGGMTEVIEDGVNGWLFTNREVAALVAKIIHFLSLSDTQRDAITQKAKETVQQQHPSHRLAEDMINLYKTALQKPSFDENRISASGFAGVH
ncbi:MAG: glycosyltransferase family 4 protein [Saprospiraceae bacterium]|nr:glycosyltransferase family 4 protein [Saprospiraceae bacterium]